MPSLFKAIKETYWQLHIQIGILAAIPAPCPHMPMERTKLGKLAAHYADIEWADANTCWVRGSSSNKDEVCIGLAPARDADWTHLPASPCSKLSLSLAYSTSGGAGV